jgi:hypothetical protein
MGKALLAAIIAAALLVPVNATALENEDLLALVAMPLAVAAVSEITDVPTSELIDVVTLLNDAAVPPPQFIEVVRYVPVALVVDDSQPDFVNFVRVQTTEGLRGTELVTSIAEQFRVYGLPEVDLAVTRPRTIDVVEETFIPAPVRTRLAEVRRSHPHGGPPGQLKKEQGLQTGAEIVHRDETPNGVVTRSAQRDDDDQKARKPRPHKAVVHQDRVDDDRARAVAKARGNDDHGRGHADVHGNGKDNGKGHGNGSGGGHGKGKGKG